MLKREPIPWRLPYIGPAKEYALREHLLLITPVNSWLDVIEPGDPVELVHPSSFAMLTYCGVCYVKKSYIGVLSPIEINIWLPDATRKDVVQILSEGYQVELDLESVVTVIALCSCESADDAKQATLDVIRDWEPDYYLKHFVTAAIEQGEY